MERAGIPGVLITALPDLAQRVGANRIVAGVRMPHPVGDPSLPLEKERALRRRIVETALKALQTEVGEPTVFIVAKSGP